jgi:hypothetical protein
MSALPDFRQGERVRIGVGASLGECTEAAARVADVGEVDVPVHDVGHDLANGIPP